MAINSGLKRRLRLVHLVAASAGLALASSVYSAAAQAATATGGLWVLLAVAIAGGVSLLAGRQFGLLARRYPSAGGVQVYIFHAFGMRLATAVSLLYVVLALAAGAVEAYVFGTVLHYLAGHLLLAWLSAVPPIGWVTLVLALFFLVNFFGIETAGTVQNWLTYAMFILLAAISIAVLVKTGLTAEHAATAAAGIAARGGGIGAVASGAPAAQAIHASGAFPGAGALMTAVAVSVFLYIGFEWVTPLSEESTDSGRMGTAMAIAIGLLGVSYLLFSAALVRGVPLARLTGQPVPHLILGQLQFGWGGLAIMGVVSALATFTSFNAGMMGNSRLLYAMAREGTLPRFLAKVHMRFFTPWAALAVMFALEWLFTLWLTLTGAYLVPMMTAVGVECLIYVLVAAAVIRLSRTEPAGWPRSARWIAGVTLALYALLGLATMMPPTPIWTPVLFAGGLAVCIVYAWARVKPQPTE